MESLSAFHLWIKPETSHLATSLLSNLSHLSSLLPSHHFQLAALLPFNFSQLTTPLPSRLSYIPSSLTSHRSQLPSSLPSHLSHLIHSKSFQKNIRPSVFPQIGIWNKVPSIITLKRIHFSSPRNRSQTTGFDTRFANHYTT